MGAEWDFLGQSLWIPSSKTNIAMENCHLYWIFPLKMVISNSYVSLPDGTPQGIDTLW